MIWGKAKAEGGYECFASHIFSYHNCVCLYFVCYGDAMLNLPLTSHSLQTKISLQDPLIIYMGDLCFIYQSSIINKGLRNDQL